MPAKHISEQEIANNRAKLAERFGNTVRRHFWVFIPVDPYWWKPAPQKAG